MNWHNLQEKVFQKLSWVFDFSRVVIILVILILITHFFIATIFVVSGESMEMDFHNGEYLLINRLDKNSLKRGDVIGFNYPGMSGEKYIKRVIGLPGEKVKIADNKITIYNNEHPQGFVLSDGAYLSSDVITEGNKIWLVGQNEYFVLGDNRENSSDSRLWGTLPEKYIVGRAILVLWPLKNINAINRVDY